MKKLFSLITFVLCVLLFGVPTVQADSLSFSCNQDVCYMINDNAGKLVIGTDGDYDIELLTGQGATATGLLINATTGDLTPLADGTHDLGTSSLEFQDIYIDGTANIDALTTGAAAISGDLTLTAADVVIVTTDRGMGASTASTTVKVCGGVAGTGCDAEAIGSWIVMEGVDFGGSGVGGGIQIEGAAGDATSDVKIGTNFDDADILLAGGTTQATRVTVEGDTGDVTLATGTLVFSTAGEGITQKVGTIAAAGSGQGDATAILARITTVTGADSTKAAVLPTPAAGDEYTIAHTTAGQTLPVFPASGGTINALSANAALTMAASTVVYCVASSTTQWWCSEGVIPA